MNDREFIERHFDSFVDHVLLDTDAQFWADLLDRGCYGFMQLDALADLRARMKHWRGRVESHEGVLDDAEAEFLAKRQEVMEEEASRLAQAAADDRCATMSEDAARAYLYASIGNWWHQQDLDDEWHEHHTGKD